MAIVRVAAAVILRPDGAVLLAQRPEGKAYAGYWEFPGGKLERGESPRQALVRELHEELGLAIVDAAPWFIQRFVYPHAHVELNFFRVFAWEGEPTGHDGQAFRWQVPGSFDVAPLLPANTSVLRALQLPTIYAQLAAAAPGDAALFAGGLALARVGPQDRSPDRGRARVQALVECATPCGARILLDGGADAAGAWGCAGVHWTSAQLAAATGRPAGLLVAATCRTPADVARAGALGLDFAVVGPVLADAAEPELPPLGWDGFAAAVAGAELPVFACGGLDHGMLAEAMRHGAHGVALRAGNG